MFVLQRSAQRCNAIRHVGTQHSMSQRRLCCPLRAVGKRSVASCCSHFSSHKWGPGPVGWHAVPALGRMSPVNRPHSGACHGSRKERSNRVIARRQAHIRVARNTKQHTQNAVSWLQRGSRSFSRLPHSWRGGASRSER